MNNKFEVYLLCAGRSERMGESKPLLNFGEETLLQRISSAFINANLTEVHVIGRGDDELLARHSFELGLPYILNVEPQRGMAGSIIEAIEDCRAEWMVLSPCDLPLLSSAVIFTCAEQCNDIQIVQPECEKRNRHPVFVARQSRADLRFVLQNGETMRDFLAARTVRTVTFDDCRPFQDMDTPEDYARLHAEAGFGG